MGRRAQKRGEWAKAFGRCRQGCAATTPEEYADSMEEVNIIKQEIKDTNNNIIINTPNWN